MKRAVVSFETTSMADDRQDVDHTCNVCDVNDVTDKEMVRKGDYVPVHIIHYATK